MKRTFKVYSFMAALLFAIFWVLFYFKAQPDVALLCLFFAVTFTIGAWIIAYP